MNKTLYAHVLFLVATSFIASCFGDSMLEFVANDHVFGPEDISRKELAEKIYRRTIIESEDKPGFLCFVPDACGEDLFGPPFSADEEEEVLVDTDTVLITEEE